MPARIPRVTRTEALVLRHRRLGEADRIVTLLTPGRGKVDAVAKGLLRARSKLAGHLEPLTQVEVVLAHGRSMDIVTQAQMVEGFEGLRGDLDRLSTGMYLLELADRFTVEQAEAPGVYELLLAALVRVTRGDGLHLATRAFELALLEVTGFRPEWSVCIACGTTVEAERASWSATGGGVVCSACTTIHPEALAIEPAVLKVLRAIQQTSYEEAARIRITPALAAGLERVMHALMRAVTERALVSARFVAEARRVAPPAASAETAAEDASYTRSQTN